MSVKIAINGFGRIGSLAFRRLFGTGGSEIVAINDLTEPAIIAHLLKYNSTQGRYAQADKVAAGEDSITVDGRTIRVFAEPNIEKLPWAQLGVDVVLECTGDFRNRVNPEKHLEAGAKKVVVSENVHVYSRSMKTVVFGVNEDVLTQEDTVISASSCTTNALALMAKALNERMPVVCGAVTALHAYTRDQMTLDGPHRKGFVQKSRAAAVNIVPTETEAVRAVGLVVPELNGKLVGSAMRVPVPVGSAVILTAVVKGSDVTADGVNAVMQAAVCDSFGYTDEPLVSRDVVGTTYGSLFDATQTLVNRIDDDAHQVQVVAWFDNESGYAGQLVRTVKRFSQLL